jgi:hypothetical protein
MSVKSKLLNVKHLSGVMDAIVESQSYQNAKASAASFQQLDDALNSAQSSLASYGSAFLQYQQVSYDENMTPVDTTSTSQQRMAAQPLAVTARKLKSLVAEGQSISPRSLTRHYLDPPAFEVIQFPDDRTLTHGSYKFHASNLSFTDVTTNGRSYRIALLPQLTRLSLGLGWSTITWCIYYPSTSKFKVVSLQIGDPYYHVSDWFDDESIVDVDPYGNIGVEYEYGSNRSVSVWNTVWGASISSLTGTNPFAACEIAEFGEGSTTSSSPSRRELPVENTVLDETNSVLSQLSQAFSDLLSNLPVADEGSDPTPAE